MSDSATFGQLLHGTARVWRQKLDERLKPMGLSQAKWRTLMHLSLAEDALTQAEIAARLGVEEPTVVTLLHRLERESWRCQCMPAMTATRHIGIRFQQEGRQVPAGEKSNETRSC